MATTNNYENLTQCKSCRCAEGDTNFWTTKTSDNPDKQTQKCPNCQVLKSGTLFLSSKGIGWTSWKKRWFILTRTSLVFYRSDPNAVPQKGNEANLTLGGIDLNNSGSVVVKADKKLLTVLFPDGRDGRTFTLKAETSEDLHEWRTALENALAESPSPVLAMGQNGILRNEVVDSVEAPAEQWKDRRPVKSLVVGRPILLALEDIDGSPSFLEKALRFIEDHGIKVEGILRQSADVEEVERRVWEYEQGKVEFSSDEDAHVVGDCIKHILRELPSSPVPATSCTALVEAYRTDRGSRINAMRAAITDTFPEPNRRLVQRILKMMRTIASNKSVNRMTLSAVAACMAPLLLRPLLAGDCELEDDFNMGGDGSLQLLQAAAAANHAQAIVIILLEEYERIFDEDTLEEVSVASDVYSESEDCGVEDEHSTDIGSLDDEGFNDDNDLDADVEDDSECSSSRTPGESNSDDGDDMYQNKASVEQQSDSSSLMDSEIVAVVETLPKTTETSMEQHTLTDAPLSPHVSLHNDPVSQSENNNSLGFHDHRCNDAISVVYSHNIPLNSDSQFSLSSIDECTTESTEPVVRNKQRTVWGRTPGRKNLSMESINFSGEEEIAIKRLEMTMDDLQAKISNEVKGNEILQASLEKRKEVLHERRLALEQDVERLQEQLQKEVDMRECLEAGLLNLGPGQLPITSSMDSKIKESLEEISLVEADISNLKQKATNLHGHLSHQKQHSFAFLCESCSQQLHKMYQSTEMTQQIDIDSTTLVHKREASRKEEDSWSSSRSALENLKDREQSSPSSLNEESSQNQQLTSQMQKATSSGFTSSQYTDISTAAAVDPFQKSFANVKKLSQGAVDSNLKSQIMDSSSSPRSQFHEAAPKKSSSRKENSMLGTEFENMKSQIADSPFSPKKQLNDKLQPSRTSPRSAKYVESTNISSLEPTFSGHASSVSCGNGASKMVLDGASPISRDEDSMHGAGCDFLKAQKKDLPCPANNQGRVKSLSKTTKGNSKSRGNNCALSTEEPGTSGNSNNLKESCFSNETLEIERSFQNSITTQRYSSAYVEESKTVGHGGASKKATSKGENSRLGGHSDSPRTQTQDSLSSPEKHCSQKLRLERANQSGHKSKDPNFSSSEETTILGRSTASKMSCFRGESPKVESQDSPSSTNRQSSQKQQSNNTYQSNTKSLAPSTFSSSDESISNRNFGSKRSSSRGEETTPSSALAKLTNRLNFLKERRVQLVNELQNLDVSRTFGSEGLPPR